MTSTDTGFPGSPARATGTDARATGTNARATGTDARATGTNAQATGTHAQATGTNAQATGTNAQATGTHADATGSDVRPTDTETGGTSRGTRDRAAANGGGSPSLPWVHWWRAQPPWVLPVLIAVIQVGGRALVDGPFHLSSTHALPTYAAQLIEWFGFPLLLIGPAALLWRHRRPLLTLAVALLATHVYLLLGYPRGPFVLAGSAALVGATIRARRVAVWTVTTLCLVPLLATLYLVDVFAHVQIRPGLFVGDFIGLDTPMTTAALALAFTVAGLAVGEFVRAQRERSAASERARAEAERAQAEAERARDEHTRRLASDERLRIAQELHDVIGHHLSLINVRAGVALHLFDRQPGQAREALEAIKLASAEALREVRGLLATLTPRRAPRTPTPDLAALDDLVAEAEAAGTPVHIVRTGQPRPLPGEVERAAYRIVREALTNVRRHAGLGALVTVTLDYAPDGLTVRVADTGSGPSTPDGDAATGSGIAGMRERASSLGGWLHAGPGPDGVGFVVEAFLPARRKDGADAGEAP